MYLMKEDFLTYQSKTQCTVLTADSVVNDARISPTMILGHVCWPSLGQLNSSYIETPNIGTHLG